jgi:predicted dehydrogenase
MPSGSGMKVGIGLIGVGRHGSRYVHHLLHDLPGVTLAAICRRRVGEGLAAENVPVYSDYHAMIDDPRVHAVVVVTHPSLCRDICLAAVRAGKPILIEKPLAMCGEETRAMVAAADKAGVLLMTAQTMRFDPTILLLKEQLVTIGPLQSATLISHIDTKANIPAGTATALPLGALLEIGIHLLDLVRFLSGEEVVEVQCRMSPLASLAPETRATAQLRTVDGLNCLLDIARVESQRVGRTEWVGGGGSVTADWVQRRVTRSADRGPVDEWTVEPRPTVLATLQAFVLAVETGMPPPVTGLDGCRAVELADACYRSAERGGTWIPVSTVF